MIGEAELRAYYEAYEEEGRLATRHGSVEFLTTVRYVERYLRPGMRLLEIGAGTGRYAHHFARQGYAVDAVELVERNIEVFRAHTQPGERIRVWQGSATDLDWLPADGYDLVLLLGPMYHLFTDADRRRALTEALRVTKPGGLLFVAYLMNEPTVIKYCFQRGNLRRVLDGGLLDPVTFKARSTPRELFVLYRREEIDALAGELTARRLHFVGTDLFTHYMRDTVEGMDDETFAQYLRYHFCVCERADLTGISAHTLDILRKE